MNDYERDQITKTLEDQLITPSEQRIVCEECGNDITGEERYEICGCVFCAVCVDAFKVEG